VLVFLVLHPLALAGSFVLGAILSILLVAITATFERLGLRMRGYRRLSRDEVRQVAPLVKSAADALDLPALPRFAMADQLIPNAWSHMRTIVLTTGLLQTLEPREVEAVLVHELTHWRNGDAVGLQCVWAASLPVALLYNLGAAIAGNRANQQGAVRVTVSSAFRWLVAWLIAWPAWVMVRVILAPLTAASQRRYEYEADAAAYDIGLGPQLRSALTKLGAFESGRTGWEVAMTATHPPTQLRIEALQDPKDDDWEYQEEELHGPSWAEVRRIFGGLVGPA
jgi:Zn-dependent protease with chaperone function